MRATIPAALAAGLLTAGCATDSPTLQRTLVMQSAYDPLTCPEVVAKYKGADARAKELAALREKSGNAIANAIAYDSEYTQVLANKRYAEEAAERKGCDLAGKPPATPPPPPAATAPEAKQADTKKQ
jgi:hypothetical protein